jgi:hydroxymethylpyrimidine pyrophosphatase-like HAD family hydrolase
MDVDCRLIVTDLDGTLFNAQSTISAANANALRRVIDSGIPVAIASGRRFGPFALQAAAMIGRPMYLILCNGAVVVGPDFKEVLYRQVLAPEDTRWLVQLGCSKPNVVWNRFADELDLLWRREDGRPEVPDMPPEVWTTAVSPDDVLTRCGPDVIRVRIWGSDAQMAELLASLDGRMFSAEQYPYPGRGDSYVEFLAPGVCKSTAIDFLARRLGFGLENVVAFGDGTNDVGMLADVGLGIAMANGTDAARAAAKLVTRLPHDEDGVADALEELFGKHRSTGPVRA